MKALVTGATGCLGRNLVTRLIQQGWQVQATGRNIEIGTLLENQGAQFHAADLQDRHTIQQLCKNQDIVFHCAALSSPWGKYADFYQTNVVGTQNVVAGCLQHNVHRLVHVSTPSIYFDFTEKHQIKEMDRLPKKAVNHYAATKLLAENMIDTAYQKYALPVVTLRPRAIFGPFDTAIMPRILRMANSGKIPLIDGGNGLIDVTYVDNVVDSMLLCANAPKHVLGKKYNITNNEPIPLKYLLQRTLAALNLPYQPIELSYKTAYCIAVLMESIASLPFVRWEPPLTRYSVGVFSISQTLDITAASHELRYKPAVTVDQGIKLFADWWRKTHYAA